MNNKHVFIFAVLIVLLGFFSTGGYRMTGGAIASDVSVSDLECHMSTKDTNKYELCGNVNWRGNDGDHIKALVNGVDNLKTAKEYTDPTFRFCSQTERTGTYSVNFYIFNANGKMQHKDLGRQVTCERTISTEPDFRDYINFVANGGTPPSKGHGTVAVDLPAEPVSCEFIGTYETQKKPFGAQYDSEDKTGYFCTGLKGSFYGQIDATGQRGWDDADYGIWMGASQGKINPEKRDYDGMILYIRLCDPRYFDETFRIEHENYVKAKVAKFGKHLTIDWTYKDDQYRPQLLVKTYVLCKLKQTSSGLILPKENKQIYTGEEVAENVEINLEDTEPLEPYDETEQPAAEAPQRLSWWQRLLQFFRG